MVALMILIGVAFWGVIGFLAAKSLVSGNGPVPGPLLKLAQLCEHDPELLKKCAIAGGVATLVLAGLAWYAIHSVSFFGHWLLLAAALSLATGLAGGTLVAFQQAQRRGG